jgi:virulence-associated protein VagC
MATVIVEITHSADGQFVRLPSEFRFHTSSVSIRREGTAIILEPVKPTTWPEGFFEKIRIDDPAFTRPDQGPMPPPPVLD